VVRVIGLFRLQSFAFEPYPGNTLDRKAGDPVQTLGR